MRKKQKKKWLWIMIIISLIFLFVDVFDILSKANITLNLDAWNIYVIILIFCITYVSLDSKDIERKKNQEEVAIELVQSTYDSVAEYLEMFGTKSFYEIINNKISGDEILPENRAYNNLKNAPFGFEERIYSFAKEGVISASNIKCYNDVKQKYQKYFTTVVVFGDCPDVTSKARKEAWDTIDLAQKELKKMSTLKSAK